MKQTNQTAVTYFIIEGISDVPQLQVPIFFLVLLIYLITIGGNLTIFLIACLDHQLHTPMYFFLGNLSVLDMSSTTVTLHKVLTSFISGVKTVSLPNCFAQVYFFTAFMGDELLILTAMSYDRYVAICNPLHYYTIMSHRICSLLATLCWIISFMEALPCLGLLYKISSYKSNIIHHFVCDLVPVMKISNSDTSILELYIFIQGGVFGVFTPFLFTFISYAFIIATITKIRSSTGRWKAFYTCSSHLTVVVLLYATIVCQYMRPPSNVSLEFNKLFSLFNAAAVPLLNPLIYSLKNKDVKSALRRQLKSSKVLK